MALTTCPDCQHGISDAADHCINCGRPMQGSNPPPVAAPRYEALPRLLGLLGAGLLFLGVFTPIVSAPFLGSQNYFQNGEGDGIIIVAMAIVAIGMILSGRLRLVWLPGAAALAMLAFTFFSFRRGLGSIRDEMIAELAGNPFAGLGEAMLGSVQLQWGWAVLVLGGTLLIAAAIAARKSSLI